MLSWFLHMIIGCYLSVASLIKFVELLLTFSSLLVLVFLFEYCVFQSMLSCLCRGVVALANSGVNDVLFGANHAHSHFVWKFSVSQFELGNIFVHLLYFTLVLI